MSAPTDADICRSAAAYLRKHGLLKNWLGVHGGPRCMVGALMSALRSIYPEPRDRGVTCKAESPRGAIERIADVMPVWNLKLYSDGNDVTAEDAARMLEQIAERLS